MIINAWANIFLLLMAWKQQQPLKGIVTPLSTPLKSQDVIDKPGTSKLIEHVLEGGVSGIFLLGSTGEGPSLSYETRKEFVTYCCDVVANRVPVLVSVSDPVFAETIAMARFAKQAGAAAIVLTQPYYYTMGQSEMIHYVEKILKEIPNDLPIMLYNIPFLTKLSWDVGTVQILAKRHPTRIIGMKDSSGDLSYFQKLCKIINKKEFPNFTIMIGPEHLLPQAMDAGGDGGVNGGSNVLPKLFVSLYETLLTSEAAASSSDQQQQQQQQKIQALVEIVNDFQQIYNVRGSPTDYPFSRFISGTKYGLAAKGILCDSTYVNQPFSSSEDKDSQLLLTKKTKDILSPLEERLKEIL